MLKKTGEIKVFKRKEKDSEEIIIKESELAEQYVIDDLVNDSDNNKKRFDKIKSINKSFQKKGEQ